MSNEKPLNVRVAEALGWTQVHQRGTAGCCGDILLPGIRWAGRAPGNGLVGHDGFHDSVPPYGDDTPDGWACTGPLIQRFELSVISPTPASHAWGCLIIDTDRISMGAHACAAVAEWVARYATEAKR